MIVVMPDAGNPWYVNWAASECEQCNNWEDHIVRDVIGHSMSVQYEVIQRALGRRPGAKRR